MAKAKFSVEIDIETGHICYAAEGTAVNICTAVAYGLDEMFTTLNKQRKGAGTSLRNSFLAAMVNNPLEECMNDDSCLKILKSQNVRSSEEFYKEHGIFQTFA